MPTNRPNKPRNAPLSLLLQLLCASRAPTFSLTVVNGQEIVTVQSPGTERTEPVWPDPHPFVGRHVVDCAFCCDSAPVRS